MNGVLDAGPDERTVSMAAVDAAAARAALADHLQLAPVDLEHPALIAVLAAVVAAGWRPPAAPVSPGMAADPASEPPAPALFDTGFDEALSPADTAESMDRAGRWGFPW